MPLKACLSLFALCCSTVSFASRDGGPTDDSTCIAEYVAMAPCPGKEKAVSSGTFVYKPRVDIPLTAATVGWTLYAFSQVYSKPNSTAAQIEQLNKNNLAWFDRWAAGMSSKDADSKSNLLFYGGLSFPFFLLADRKVRADAPKVGLLYLETMAITGFLYTSATYWDDRYRPETYDQSIPVADRQGGNYKNAFFAGHVAQVASFSFFTAKIYDTYHPHSPWKWAFYGGAALTTGTTIYLRHRAGKHFPSDILLGTAVGTLSGILVPQLHKRKNAAGQGWQLSPETRFGTTGLCATYHIR